MPQTFFINRATHWQALHPLTKLAVALALITTAFSVRWVFISIALFVLVILPIAVWAKIWRELVRTSFFAVLPIGISVAFIQGFFYPGAQDIIFQLGPFALTREGLESAFVIISRFAVFAGAGLLVMYSTHPADLALALVQIGAPYPVAYIIVTAIQLLPDMQARADGILNAQQARGLETTGGLRTRIAAFVPLVSPLVYGALENVQERALALDARGFRAPRPKTNWRILTDSPAQKVLRISLVAYSVLLALYAIVTMFVSF